MSFNSLLAKRSAVFLDRDGVLNRAVIHNRKPFSPGTVGEVEIPPEVPGGCAELRRHGFVLVVITNQPEVARGTISREAVEEIHGYLRTRIPLDDIRVCYHDDSDRCSCRKPKPGMILSAARDWNVDLAASFLIGDRWRDIEAGRGAGCRTVFLDRQHDEAPPERADFSTTSFTEAVAWILAHSVPPGPLPE